VRQLTNRFKEGNQKLWGQVERIRRLPTSKQKFYWQEWEKARQGLMEIACSLQGCPYSPFDPPYHPCLACPVENESWKKEECPAWNLEL